jgi:starch synthase
VGESITNATVETLATGTANGFSFDCYTTAALADAVERACGTFTNRDRWAQLVRNGMQQDWSWNHSAREYGRLYKHTLARAAVPTSF